MIDRLAYRFIQPFPYWDKYALFRKVLYIFLILNALTLLPIASEIYGYKGIVGTAGWNTNQPFYLQGSQALLNLLSHPRNANHPWIMYVFVYGQIAALIAGVFNKFPRLMAVLIYFFTANLFQKGYLVFTGGEALISILLFYMIFIQEVEPENKPQNYRFNFFQNLLNNTFYWIILIQICFLYFFSTLYKLMDPYWLNGEALMYVARIDAFSGDTMRMLFSDHAVLAQLATYFVLAYQGLFPLLVWIKSTKLWLLLCGFLIHLGIAFGMGIFTFGIVMCLTYILFLDQAEIDKIKRIFSLKRRTNSV